MKMLAKVILITSLTLQAISSCSLGCLACNEKQKCILCDFKSGYYFKDFKCIQTNIEKCAAIDLNGNCLLCLPPHILDSANNQCRSINDQNQQLQCIRYSSTDVCLTCKGNFYPLNGKCTALPTVNQLAQCLSYSGLGECSSCSTGYLPNYLGSVCLPDQNSQNCLLRTNIQCSSCPADYIQNRDYIRINIQLALKSLSQAQNETEVKAKQEGLQKGFDLLIKQKIPAQDNCLKKTVSDCLQFEQFDKCFKCQTGFYLENGQCIAQPIQAIPFCMTYRSLTECKTCMQGYFVETPSKCTQVKTIDNCDVYDGSKTQTICLICNRNYFLQQDINTCKKRVNFIDLCEEYFIKEDKCQKCQKTNETYLLTSDFLKCIPQIFKCNSYENSTKDTSALKCLTCVDEYYWSLIENKCVLGTIGFCRVYNNNENICQECINGYFLQSDINGQLKCVPHFFQSGCLTYNNKTTDECAVCQEGSILMTQQTECLPVNIEGCVTYDTRTQCLTCSNGYDLSNGICIKLSESSNCVISVDGKCQQCASSYFQLSGQCYPGFEYQQQHCFNSKLDEQNNYDGHLCSICHRYNIPFNLKNHFVCISNHQLEIFYQYNLYSSYCDSYILDNLGKLICNSCREGFIFSNNDCVEKCDVNQTFVDDYLILKDQQLVYNKHKTCFGDAQGRNALGDKYGQNESFDGNFSPLNFSSSKAFKIDHSVSTSINIATQQNIPFGRAVSPNLYVFPQFSTIINANLQDKCYLYQNQPDSTESCATCQFGHFGIIDNWYVPNCHTYDQTKCIKCVHGMLPSQNGLSCVQHTPVKGCLRYAFTENKCLECHSLYYLDYTNQTCLTNTVENCLYPQKFQNKCWRCQQGYILNNDSSKCYAEIEECKVYDLTGANTVCLLCNNNCYLTSNQCIKIPEKYCWFWESGATGTYANGVGTKTCLFNSNILQVTSIDQCSPIATVKHCIDYQDENTCLHCKDGHYLVDGHCCVYGTNPLVNDLKTAECTGAGVDNCMTYEKNPQGVYLCIKCNYLYHLNPANTTQGKCCPYGQFWQNAFGGPGGTDVGVGACVSLLDYNAVNRNTPNCKLFSNDQQKCNVCDDNFYFSQGFCCPLNQYWNTTSKSCKSIATDKLVSNCLEWSDDETQKCKVCAPNHITNQCCSNTEYLEVSPADNTKLICIAIPAGSNCATYNKDQFCKVCDNNFYKSEALQKVCCPKGVSYYNPATQSCSTVIAGNLIPNCFEYNTLQQCTQCDDNTADFKWLNPLKSCCSSGQYWDGTRCQGIFNNNLGQCGRVEKGVWKNFIGQNQLYDYMCSSCLSGFQLKVDTSLDPTSENTFCAAITDPNCKRVETTVNNTVPKCLECKDKYAFQSNNICCDEGNYIMLTTHTIGDCSNMYEQIKNCYYFDMVTFTCRDFTSDDLANSHPEYDAITFYDKGACGWNINGNYQFDSENAAFNKQCTIFTQIGNCEIHSANQAACLQCKRGFFLENATTCTSQTNCITQYSTPCINCIAGLLDNQTAQCNIALIFPSGNTLNYCTQIVAGSCKRCLLGYYLNVHSTTATLNQCCQYGYYYNFTKNTCLQIESPNCSKQTSSTVNAATGRPDCTQCYLSDDLCDNDDTFFFDIQDPHYSINVSRKKMQSSPLFINAKNKVQFYHFKNVWMDNTKKQCCLVGQFYSLTEKKCVSLGITNCLEGTFDNNSLSSKCTKCEVGYELLNDICKKYDAQSCKFTAIDPVDQIPKDLYVSNSNCCLQGTMWSDLDNKCIPIVDPFCLESQKVGLCSKCKTGYSHVVDKEKQSLPIINFAFMNFNELARCPKINRNFQYHSCMPDKIVQNANLYTYDKIYLKIKHCGEFDIKTTHKCTKCMSNAYMADSVKGICCLKGEVLVDNLCVKSQELDVINNCYSYDLENKKCLKCKLGYNLQLGTCCPEGYYINPFNKECQYYYPDCANFLNEYSTCDRCYPGYYMSQGRCCRFGSRWIQMKQTCEIFFTDFLYSCQKGASENNCQKCITEKVNYQDNQDNVYEGDVYLYNGKCFGRRSFERGAIDGKTANGAETDAPISTLRDFVNDNPGFFHCAKVDEYNNCSQCIQGFNLYSHDFVTVRRLVVTYGNGTTETICCPSGYYYHALTGTGFVCQSALYSEGCDRMKMNTAGTQIVCDTCLSGYFKSKDFCCPKNFTWSTEKKSCVKLYIEELQNCLENARDSDDECTLCKTGYYLSLEKRCCKDGYYWDTDAKNCLSINLLNLTVICNQALKDGNVYKCSKCTTTTQIYDTTNNICVERVANNAVDQNCLVKTTGTPGDNCTVCANNSYKSISSQKPCCPENEYFNQTLGICESSSLSTLESNALRNCKTVKYTTFNPLTGRECVCKSGHFSLGTSNQLCTSFDFNTILNNCAKLNAGGTSCSICDKGFHVNSADVTKCVDTFISSFGEHSSQCSGANSTLSPGQCVHCQTGYYLTKKKCCLQGYYWNSNLQQCQQTTYTEDVMNCARIDDNGNCIDCNNTLEFYKSASSPFMCCKKGNYYDTKLFSCSKDFFQLSSSLSKCNLFNVDQFGKLQCRSPDANELSTTPLLQTCDANTHYFTNKRCCENNFFFQISGENCILISSQYAQYTHCSQLNDEDQCQKCKDPAAQYISNGNCCNFGQYKPIDSANNQCVAMPWDSACRQIIYNQVLRRYQCTQCTGNNNNPEFTECCAGKYIPAGTSVCQNNLSNCNVMNADGSCNTCNTNYYISNGKCCQNGFFFQNNQCTAISPTLNCQQVALSRTDNSSYCSLCSNTIDQLQPSDGKCCKKGYVYVKDHPLTNCIPKVNLFDYCLAFDSKGSKCLECDSEHDLTMGICCPKKQHHFLNSDNHYGCSYNFIINCHVQESQTTCSSCDEGYYLTNSNQSCCKIGYQFINGKCSEKEVRVNCTGFDNTSQCVSCVSGYYISKDSKGNSHCCQDGQYVKLFLDVPVCISFQVLTANCELWDTTGDVFDCLKFQPNAYQSGPVCCPKNKYFNSATQTCENITILYQCEQATDDGKCKVCKSGNYYLTNGRCCPFGRYWDSLNQECLDNPYAWCKEYVDGSIIKCKSCLTSFFPSYNPSVEQTGVNMTNTLYLSDEHCCNKTNYWDDSLGKCVKKIDNCEQYSVNKITEGANITIKALCSVCLSGFVKTKDQLNCCKNYEFYNEESKKCISTASIANVYEGCIDWNEQSLLCQKCDPASYYLSTSQNLSITLCCKYDSFVDDNTKKCALINKVQYPNCTQVSQGKCSVCETNYALKDSTFTCVKVMDFCVKFNPENSTCTACDTKHYLSNGVCCGEMQFAIDVNSTKQCVSSSTGFPQITNCLQYIHDDNTKCAICVEKYYVSSSQSKCVSDFMFWNGTAEVQGNVQFCERYGTSADQCLRCVHSHSLMQGRADSNIPLDQNLLTSTLRTFYTTNQTPLKHFCVRTELDSCLNSRFVAQDDNSTDNKAQCISCKRNFFVQNLTAGNEVVRLRQHYKVPNCKHQFTHKLYSLSTFQCAECENNFYLNQTNRQCFARTSKFTSNCLVNDLFTDKCVKCVIRYSLVNGECIIPSSPCLQVSGSSDCQVCDHLISYTQFLDSEPLDQKCYLHTEFAGESVASNPPDIFIGSMRKCELHHQCTDEFLHNLNIETHKYLSCHVCKDSNRIPFVSLSISNQGLIKGIKRYSMWNSSNQKLTNYLEHKENKQSECFKTDFSEFTLPSSQNASLFPANCAVGAFNTDHPLNLLHSTKNNADTDFDYTKATAICLECKPGYRAIRNTFFQMVRSCEAILNCKTSNGTSFSQCEECLDGFYFKYNSSKLFGGIDKGTCYQSTENHDQFCYAFDEINKNCHTCRNGYSKNHDGKCEKLSTPFCQTNFNFNRSFAKEEYNLAYYRGEQGCTKCKDGYERIYRKQDDFVCFTSSHQLNLPAVTKYVPNCEYYFNEVVSINQKVLKCFKCAENFIITDNGVCISKASQHQNCLVAVNESTCHSCNTDFYLISGLCKAGEVQNCSSYVIIDGKLECNTCQDYHFLNNLKVCQKGEIQFCKVFSGLTSCVTCDANYQLVELSNNTHYCLYVGEHSNNCEDSGLSEIQLANMNLFCNVCKKNSLQELIFNRRICVRFNLIKNCIKYNRGSDFASSTFLCEQCEGHTFLNTKGQCQDRQNTVTACLKYSVNRDQCEECRQNYFLDLTGLNCLANPSGLLGCANYASKTTCAQCFSDFFLENGNCVTLPSLNRIPGCVAYNSQKLCVLCGSNSLLVDQKCQANSVSNCLEHQTPVSCSICNPGFGISNVDNLNKCISLPNIPGCIQQSQFEPYLCDLCEINQYLDDKGKCQPLDPTKQIVNCIEYGSDQLCQQCRQGFALSLNKTICFQIFENIKCLESSESNSNFCDLCSPGYKLDSNGSCVTTLAQQINGCFSSKYDKDDQCAICNFGFSMKTDFTCRTHESLINEINGTNGSNGNSGSNGGTGTPTNDAEIMKMAMRLVFLLFFLF